MFGIMAILIFFSSFSFDQRKPYCLSRVTTAEDRGCCNSSDRSANSSKESSKEIEASEEAVGR